jgi:hypothetical protein
MDNNAPSRYWRVLPAALALSGVIVFIFATHGPPASSSGFVSAIKGGLTWFAPEYAAEKAHYSSLPAAGSWLFAFVVGMAIGGFIAGRTSGRSVDDVPPIWRERFGKSRLFRYAATFIGGFLILFSARLAGGCTLGLFISGSTQLALSGLFFGGIIFAAAMLTARLVYGGKAGREESA